MGRRGGSPSKCCDQRVRSQMKDSAALSSLVGYSSRSSIAELYPSYQRFAHCQAHAQTHAHLSRVYSTQLRPSFFCGQRPTFRFLRLSSWPGHWLLDARRELTEGEGESGRRTDVARVPAAGQVSADGRKSSRSWQTMLLGRPR